MKKKSAFTLIELMASLSIFSILTVLLSGMYVQTYKITAKTNKDNQVQDEYRKSLMIMENDIKDSYKKKYDTYIYNENKQCKILDTDENNSVVGEQSAKPLVLIQSGKMSDDYKILYVLVDNKYGGYNLEQIEFVDTSGSIEEDSNAVFNVKPMKKKRMILAKDIKNVLLEKENGENKNDILKINFIINSLNGYEREYETAISLERGDEIVIEIKNKDDDIVQYDKAVSGIFNHYNNGVGKFYLGVNFEITDGIFFDKVSGGETATHSTECNHSDKNNMVYYDKIIGASKNNNNNIIETFTCGNGSNSKGKIIEYFPSEEIKINGLKEVNNGILKRKVGDNFITISSPKTMYYVDNYRFNNNEFNIIICNDELDISNYQPAQRESFNDNTLIIISKSNINVVGDSDFSATNLVLVSSMINAYKNSKESLESFSIVNGLIYTQAKINIQSKKTEIKGNLGSEYSLIINLINKSLRGDILWD